MLRGLLAALLLAVPSSVCGSRLPKGQGQGCPWGYGSLGTRGAKGVMANLFAVFSQEKKIRLLGREDVVSACLYPKLCTPGRVTWL